MRFRRVPKNVRRGVTPKSPQDALGASLIEYWGHDVGSLTTTVWTGVNGNTIQSLTGGRIFVSNPDAVTCSSSGVYRCALAVPQKVKYLAVVQELSTSFATGNYRCITAMGTATTVDWLSLGRKDNEVATRYLNGTSAAVAGTDARTKGYYELLNEEATPDLIYRTGINGVDVGTPTSVVASPPNVSHLKLWLTMDAASLFTVERIARIVIASEPPSATQRAEIFSYFKALDSIP